MRRWLHSVWGNNHRSTPTKYQRAKPQVFSFRRRLAFVPDPFVEYAGIAKAGWGHRRSESLYILWQYSDAEWIELGRVIAQGADWCVHLCPLALQALGPPPEAPPPDVEAATSRLQFALDSELLRLAAEHQIVILGRLHDFFSARISRALDGGRADSSYTHPPA